MGATQREIEALAAEIHSLIFEPAIQYPLKTLDLPAGGPVYSATSLRMVYDFIGLSVGAVSSEDDETGQRTVDYLTRCRRVMRILLSNHASSVGLHPAVYFYSWTGKQQPILFLVIADLIVDLERKKRLPSFIAVRSKFEAFLTADRSLLNQVIRKFGTKDSGVKHLRAFFDFILTKLDEGLLSAQLVDALVHESAYSYLQPAESPYDGGSQPASRG